MNLLAPAKKILAFYVVRACAGLVCALCEATLVDALRRSPQFGNRVATMTLFFLALGVGMFHASTAFVPSTTAMYVLRCTALPPCEIQKQAAGLWEASASHQRGGGRERERERERGGG